MKQHAQMRTSVGSKLLDVREKKKTFGTTVVEKIYKITLHFHYTFSENLEGFVAIKRERK